MKKKGLNEKFKIVFAFFLGAFIFGGGVYAASVINSSDVSYRSSNVQAALDELYEKAYNNCDYDIGKTWEFDYTGSSQEFVTPCKGAYKIELWGAQGNYATRKRAVGGNGAYTIGTISLGKEEKLYVYVGENRTDRLASFNAGSTGGSGNDSVNSGSVNGYGGGGATDIRLITGSWDNDASLKSRIMVAAGGGGATDYAYPVAGGFGGALIGGDGINGKYPSQGVANVPPTGGTQVAGGITSKNNSISINAGSNGTFGIGGNGNSEWGSGGGGGYYGGAGGGYTSNSVDSGAGGSSYISGHTGCIAIESADEVTAKSGCNVGTTDVTCSYHYSGKKFNGTAVKAGNESMPTHDGTSTMSGNTGNGYAKITLVGLN